MQENGFHQDRAWPGQAVHGFGTPRPYGALFGAVFMAIVSGCVGSQGPETVEVAGTVTMDGKPVEGANVIFHPLGGGEGVLASQSVTNAEGQFHLTTHVGGGNYKPGIVAGKYAVVITKLDTAAISTTFAPPQNLLPKKYGNPATSGLTAEVVPGQENSFEFPLEAI